MENYILTADYRAIAFTTSETTKEIDFAGYSKLAFMVPAAMNGLTATFLAWDPISGSWITTGQTQVLSTGYFVPSATQLAALAPLSIVRISLSAAPSANCTLTVYRKT